MSRNGVIAAYLEFLVPESWHERLDNMAAFQEIIYAYFQSSHRKLPALGVSEKIHDIIEKNIFYKF